MYWLQDKENLKGAEQAGFGKSHLKCKEIGHVWISQFNTDTWNMHYICFNCGINDTKKMKHVYKLPPTIPIGLYHTYGAIN